MHVTYFGTEKQKVQGTRSMEIFVILDELQRKLISTKLHDLQIKLKIVKKKWKIKGAFSLAGRKQRTIFKRWQNDTTHSGTVENTLLVF